MLCVLCVWGNAELRSKVSKNSWIQLAARSSSVVLLRRMFCEADWFSFGFVSFGIPQTFWFFFLLLRNKKGTQQSKQGHSEYRNEWTMNEQIIMIEVKWMYAGDCVCVCVCLMRSSSNGHDRMCYGRSILETNKWMIEWIDRVSSNARENMVPWSTLPALLRAERPFLRQKNHWPWPCLRSIDHRRYKDYLLQPNYYCNE